MESLWGPQAANIFLSYGRYDSNPRSPFNDSDAFFSQLCAIGLSHILELPQPMGTIRHMKFINPEAAERLRPLYFQAEALFRLEHITSYASEGGRGVRAALIAISLEYHDQVNV